MFFDGPATASRRRATWRWAGWLVPLSMTAIVAVLQVAELPVVADLQNKVFDELQRSRPRAYRDAPVRIVDLDEETLRRQGQWPWPRTQVAQLVERVADAGAAAIAFDMVFAEPDRTSPARAAAWWPDTPETLLLKRKAKQLPDLDVLLARTMSKTRVVTGFVLTGEARPGKPAAKARFASVGSDPKAHLPDYAGAAPTLAVLERAAAGNGCFSVLPDRDGVIRRVPLLFRHGEQLYPALSAEALRVAQGASTIVVQTVEAGGDARFGGIARVKIGDLVLPTDEEGNVRVFYSRRDAARTVPAWKVLDGTAGPGALAGAIVFFGTSAIGLKDQRTTPLEAAVPGVEIHAQVAEQALLGDFLARPFWAQAAEAWYMGLLSLLIVLALRRLGAPLCAALALAAIGGAGWLAWHFYATRNLLLDPVIPSLGIFAAFGAASFIKHLHTEAEKRQVRSAFSRYMSPALVEQLSKNPERLVLGGELRPMTVHFCDIRGFTTLSERFDPQGLTEFMNRYLTPMTQILLDHKATIDKYIGDNIMAFWNAPLDDPDHASNACRAALAMHARLKELNVALAEEAFAKGRPFLPIAIGTGLNTGSCCVGNMGSEQRFDYSVLGDEVNLASRLEGQSKVYGVDIVIGPATRAQAPGFASLELDLLRVKGKSIPVHIFALLGDEALRQKEEFKNLALLHHRMLAAYRTQGWDLARRLLAECQVQGFEELATLYRLYASRIEEFRAAPPRGDWDGTFTALTK
ncbi:MAG: adenylate/guanylate cyclase domain-containing protein [Elusimicrobia bacterium]|nr:adenylate/guanylate cyclase domain-containing protein [Elusimicrobiota bacterium]